MPAPTHSSRQGRAYDREETEDLLRGALADLMADGTPFRDLSVARFLEAVGMARSTYYKLFEDKGAMLQALAARSLRRLYDSQRAWLAKGEDVGREEITRAMRELLDAYVEDEAVMRAVAEASVYDPAVRAAYLEAVHDYMRVMERFIRRGQRGGWVRRVHPGDTAETLVWMVEGTVRHVAPGASRRRLDSVAATLADAVCRTLFTAERA